MSLTPTVLALLALLLIILTAILTFYKYCFTHWQKLNINYLEPTIPFGNASDFFQGKICIGQLFHDWYLEMKKKEWKIGGAYFCGKPILVPIDNEMIKKIIVSDFTYFPNHGLYIDEGDPLSRHIFNMEDYRWKNVRAKLPAAFTAAKMRRNVVIMEQLSRKLLDRIDHLKDASLDIRQVLMRFTIDVISACGFGLESKTLDDQNRELMLQLRPFFDKQFGRTANTLVFLFSRRFLSLFKFKLFPASTTKFFMNMFKEIKESRLQEPKKRDDLAQLLIDLCDVSKNHADFNGKGRMEPLSFDEFVAQMLVFYEAGFETSSSTQTLAFYELACNLDVQEKLRDEINSVLEGYRGKIGYDAVNEMKYLDRVVDETLRKYPIFPILPRLCTKDYQFPDSNITIKKNTILMITNLGIHYDPEYYPDPMKFDPDRFTADNKRKRPFCSYMPFGEGPRICVGKRFGIWQTKIGIVSVIKNYKVTLSDKMKLPFSFDPTGTILNAKGGVWIDLERIN